MAVDEEVSRPATQALLWIFIALSSVFVAGRLYVRIRIMNKTGIDDYIMGVSLICSYIFAILVTISIAYGMGDHTSQLTSYQQQQALLYSTASFAPGILSFTLPKLGVTALLTRILNPSRRFTLCLWVFVGVVDVLIFGCVIILWAQCNPVRALWMPELRVKPDGTQSCWNPAILTNYSIATGTLSAFVDLFLAVYPATVLWKLQMNRKKKIGLSIILGLGIFACAISIYKATRLTGLDDASDYTYSSFSIFLWTSIEANTIIIAACVPTVAPILEAFFGRRVFYNRSTGEPVSSYTGGYSYGSGYRKKRQRNIINNNDNSHKSHNNSKYSSRKYHTKESTTTTVSTTIVRDDTQRSPTALTAADRGDKAALATMKVLISTSSNAYSDDNNINNKTNDNHKSNTNNSHNNSHNSNNKGNKRGKKIKNSRNKPIININNGNSSSKTDIESQTSILERETDEDDDDDDDDYNHEDGDVSDVGGDHGHGHGYGFEDEPAGIPLDHIARRDEFKIEYGYQHQYQHQQESEGEADTDTERNNEKWPRSMVGAWKMGGKSKCAPAGDQKNRLGSLAGS